MDKIHSIAGAVNANTEHKARLGWGLFLPKNIQGDVLYIGDSSESAEFLYGKLAGSLSIYAFSFTAPECSEVGALKQYLNEENKTYDAIIIDNHQMYTSDGIENNFLVYGLLKQVLENSTSVLNIDGIIVYPERNLFSMTAIKRFFRRPLIDFFLSLCALWSFRKSDFTFKKALYAVCDESSMSEIFYNSGFVSIKNSFKPAEKFKKLIYSKNLLFLTCSVKIRIRSRRPVKPSIYSMLLSKLLFDNGKLKKGQTLRGKTILNISPSEDSSYAEGAGIVLILPEDSGSFKGRNTEIQIIRQLREKNIVDNRLLPESIGVYKLSDYSFFALKEIPGISIDTDFPYVNKATDSAHSFLIELHGASAERKLLNGEGFKLHFGRVSDLLLAQSLELELEVQRLMSLVYSRLEGSHYYQVWSHGDFKLENMIFNQETWGLNGVIDWEYSDNGGVYLMDLLYLLIYNRLIISGENFLKAYQDMILNRNFSKSELSYITFYCERFEINKQQFESWCAYFLMHHVATRITLPSEVISEYKTFLEATTEWLKYN